MLSIFGFRAIGPSSAFCRFGRAEKLERTLIEGRAGLGVDRIPSGEGLPPSDGDIDVAGVDLQA